MPLAWAALHVVKAATSLWGGALADRSGRRAAIGGGWSSYAAVYLVFASSATSTALLLAFLVYGLYFGLTEGRREGAHRGLDAGGARRTAFGVYNAVIGVGALAASLVFGLIWERLGAAAAFGTGAALALAATVLLWLAVPARARRGSQP